VQNTSRRLDSSAGQQVSQARPCLRRPAEMRRSRCCTTII